MKAPLFIYAAIIFSSCASSVRYSNEDMTANGIRVGLGSKDGVKEGDQIRVLQRDCSPNGRIKNCLFNTVGYLKVTHVNGENSSMVQGNDKIHLDDSVFFEKM